MAGLATSLGAGAASNSFNQIEGADLLFIFGSNTHEGHPIVGLHVNKAIRRGAKIIVGDPRKISLVKHSDVWLNLRPGTNIALLNGLVHVILSEGLQNEEFIRSRTEGLDELREAVKKYTPDYVQRITGVSTDKLVAAARMYAQAKNAMILYGLGVTEHRSGAENAMAIANLALVCGHIGRPSTGIMALRGQNNVQGASDMGPYPGNLPGYQPVTSPEAREKFNKAWNITIAPKPGLKSVEMYDAAIKGSFKGMYIVGWDPAHTDANIGAVQKALENTAVQKNPWGRSRAKRGAWADKMDIEIPHVSDTASKRLLFSCCIQAYDPRCMVIPSNVARILTKGGLEFGILGEEEGCCGNEIRGMGEIGLYEELMQTNIEKFETYGIKQILTSCPHGFNVLKN
ncbi:MAG: molybdopterin-dependent oxidoreductase, partial [Nitrospirales bacterium]|nr:molybdopterin-dependent oxidoreductase [Nitrospirales bacterium]